DQKKISIQEIAGISLTKTGILDGSGNTITYTFRIENKGKVTLSNLNISDNKISSGIILPVTVLAPRQVITATAIYTITQAEKNSGMVSNTALVSGNTPAGNKVSDVSGTTSENDLPTVIELSSLSSTKLVSDANNNGIAEAGEELAYSIIIKNNGNTARTGVSASDAIPLNTSYIQNSVTGNGTAANNIINWSNLTIPAKGQIVLTFKARVDNRIASGVLTINNTAIVVDPANASIPALPSVSIPTEGKLEGTKSVSDVKGNSDSKAQANEILSYTIIVKNTGGSSLRNVNVSDELPVGLTYISGTVTANGVAAGNKLSWNVNLEANASVTLNFDAKVSADVNSFSSIKNVAFVTGSNNRSIQPEANIEVDKSADLIITKELLTTGQTNTGQDVLYKITVTNKGANKATGVTMSDKIPTIIDKPKDITVTSGSTTYSENDGNLVWLVGNLDLNQTAAITFKAKTLASGTLNNSATVKADQPDLVAGNNTVSANTAFISGLELLIPNLFTPNDDGVNDAFEIRGLNEFSENELTIVNRWGNEVYKTKSYQNSWTGEGLNEGTYFYLIKVKRNGNSDWKIFKGYITLLRNFKQ
ncbi:MAG: DUF11 domain-containing protein, partial [Flavobacterium sp.]